MMNPGSNHPSSGGQPMIHNAAIVFHALCALINLLIGVWLFRWSRWSSAFAWITSVKQRVA